MRATTLPIPASEGWFLRRFLKLKLTQKENSVMHWSESYYTWATRASELHNLLGRYARTDGGGVHMLVGDILKVEG